MQLQKPPSCKGCPLEVLGDGFVLGSYADPGYKYHIALIGEALGEDEVINGYPFAGKAGAVLTRLIERTRDSVTNVGLMRRGFDIGNSISCRPPENVLVKAPYELGALNHCKQHLESFLKTARPKIIIALGATALYQLTGLGKEKSYGIEHFRGSLLESPYGPIIPTFHPSFIMRGNFKYAQVFQRDLLTALELARGSSNKPSKSSYITHPTAEAFRRFISDWRGCSTPVLSFDIETNYGGEEEASEEEEIALENTQSYQITRISFAFCGNEYITAITVPWQTPYKELSIELLATAPELTVWHENFDVPRLTAAGVNFSGQIYDAMWMFHLWKPALPYNLQFASSIIVPNYKAWKHIVNYNMERYSCLDSDMLLQCYYHVKNELEALNKWSLFQRHFVQMGKVLRKMQAYGIGTDQAKRKTVRAEFEIELAAKEQECQQFIAEDLRPRKIFKLSKERLENKFSDFGSKEWIIVREALSEKEVRKLEIKEEKAEAKRLVKLERDRVKADKKALSQSKKKQKREKRQLLED